LSQVNFVIVTTVIAQYTLSLTYQSYHSLLGRMAVDFAIIRSAVTIPQAQFTQFLQTATTAGFSLHDIWIFGWPDLDHSSYIVVGRGITSNL